MECNMYCCLTPHLKQTRPWDSSRIEQVNSSFEITSGQIIATSHDLTSKVAKEGNSPYFRKIQVGEIL